MAEFEGEWNADYHYTLKTGGESHGPTEFVDTRKIRTMKKYVKAIPLQEPTESRRLWKDVTEESVIFVKKLLIFPLTLYRK